MVEQVRATLAVMLAISVLSSDPAAAVASNSSRRLVYEIVVTAPGARSQGWHGTLYNTNGAAVQVEPGRTVDTRIGTFVSVACVHAWSTCGMIHTDMLNWLKTHNGNAILDAKRWMYKLYVLAEGSKSEGWQGQLLHGSRDVTAGDKPFVTPMGKFVWKRRAQLWDRAGWYHESWPESRS
jgi:hypothetical protein